MSELAGKKIGRYEVRGQIGHGGMATVYLAWDERLEREVAVKVIRKERIAPQDMKKLLGRFKREAKSQARLEHRYIVPVYDYGEYEGAPYLVMGYTPGGTLRDMLKGKKFNYQEAAELLAPVAEALSFAHEQGVLHRDVKPANILIDKSGTPMLADFGIAKMLEFEGETLTGTGYVVGTPGYIAPEQWQDEAMPESDMYSLGVLFYEMITGHRPFVGDTPNEVMIKKVTEPLISPKEYVPSLPKKVEGVLLKMLAVDPVKRFESMEIVSGLLWELSRGNLDSVPEYTAPSKRSPTVADGPETLDRMQPGEVSVRPVEEPRNEWRIWLLGGVGGLVLLGVLCVGGWMGVNYLRGEAGEAPAGESAALPEETETVGEPMEETVTEEVVTETAAPSDTPSPTDTATPAPTATMEGGRVHLPGSGTVRVTDGTYNYFMGSLAPDQTEMIAFADFGGNWRLLRLDMQSGAFIEWVTGSGTSYYNPHVSPNGEYIIAAASLGNGLDVCLLDYDSGEIVLNLTDSPVGEQFGDWFPDGERYVYIADYGGYDIYMGYLDGREPQRLTYGEANEYSPHVSPDGRYVAYYSSVSGNIDVYVVEVETQAVTRLTFDSARDAEPWFSPDGQWVLFESNRDGGYDIWAVRVDGSGLFQVTDMGGDQQVPYFSLDGLWLFYQQKRGDGGYDIYRIPWEH